MRAGAPSWGAGDARERSGAFVAGCLALAAAEHAAQRLQGQAREVRLIRRLHLAGPQIVTVGAEAVIGRQLR